MNDERTRWAELALTGCIIIILIIIFISATLTFLELSDKAKAEQDAMEDKVVEQITQKTEKASQETLAISQEFYWKGGEAVLKCHATVEGIVC